MAGVKGSCQARNNNPCLFVWWRAVRYANGVSGRTHDAQKTGTTNKHTWLRGRLNLPLVNPSGGLSCIHSSLCVVTVATPSACIFFSPLYNDMLFSILTFCCGDRDRLQQAREVEGLRERGRQTRT